MRQVEVENRENALPIELDKFELRDRPSALEK